MPRPRAPKTRRIVVFGDVIDDIVVVPSVPVRTDTDTPSSIRHRAGGSAANAAAWLGSLGAPVDFVGRVGASDIQRHAQYLEDAGVDARLSMDPILPTGTIVVIVDGERRNMLTERGANANLDPEAVTDDLLDAAGLLHLTGYSVVDSSDPAGLRRLIQRARDRGVDVSMDPGSAGYIADYGPDRFLEAIRGVNLLFPSLAEGRALTGETNPHAVAEALAQRFGVVALTVGGDGVIVARAGHTSTRVAAIPSRVLDPTGAGDAFCAGFIESWNRLANATSAAKAGVRLAARAVTFIGGRPPA